MVRPIVEALSRLNGHARAWGFGKKAIYAYKTFVACALADQVRPVQVQVHCHHCNATGIYRDWDGFERGPCFRCTRGTVTLRFIESRIGEDARWHHPTGDGGLEVRDAVWNVAKMEYEDGRDVCVLADGTRRSMVYEQAEGWGPNLPSEKLPTDEACRLLNLVEAQIGAMPLDRPSARWRCDRALREMALYRVSLDRDRDGACCVCGTTEGLTMCGGSCVSWGFGFADFSRPMCVACHGAGPTLRWPTEPDPASLTPNVIAWLAHPLRQQQRVVERVYDYA